MTFKSIKTKLTFTVALIVLFYTILLVLLTYGLLGDMAERSASELAETILEETNKQITAFFGDMEELALSFREYPAVYEIDPPRLQELILASVRPRRSYMRAIYLGTEGGEMLEWGYGEGFVDNEPVFSPDYDPRKRPWYKTGLEADDFAVTDPYLYASIDAVGITCVTPVYRPSGKLVGVLGFDIMLDDLQNLVAELDIGMNGQAMLVDRNGEALVNQFSEQTGKRIISLIGERKSPGTTDTEIAGERHFISLTENETTGWTLILALPINSVMAGTNRAIRFSLGLDLLLMILLLVTLEWSSRRMLIEPVEHMVETINRLREGEESARIDLRRNDEFGMLEKNFNMLADRVEEYSHRMEEKVKERTERLRHLQQENTRLRIIEEKERIYGYLHDSLGSRLTNIVISNNVARSAFCNDPDTLEDMHERIEENAQASLADLKDILASSPEEERRVFDFHTLLELHVRRRLELKNIAFHFHGESEELNVLPHDVAVETEKILQELVSNVLKHADAGTVELHTETDGGNLTILFRDDGKGFDTDSIPERSFGLGNIRSRVERRGGSMRVESAPGEGTEIRIELPPAGG